MVDEQVASSKARGKRLYYLRKELLRLSRESFGEKHNIPVASLKNWEQARYTGLTERGAKKLIPAFQQEGINCTLEWLLYGIGENPASPFPSLNQLLNTPATTNESIIAQELRLFHQLNDSAVDCIVTDNGMAPCILVGDHVAGKRYFGQDIEHTVGLPCIVQTLTGEVLVRLVKKGSYTERFTLQCTNTNTAISQPLIENVQLFSVAPILWIRRKDFLKKN